jgi:L-asparaginase II
VRSRSIRAAAREHGACLVAIGARRRDKDEIPSRIVHAMRTRPFLVGGTDRFDSVLIEETDGRVVAKIGAEGVHSIAVPNKGSALRSRSMTALSGRSSAVIRILQMLDVLPSTFRRGSTSSSGGWYEIHAAKSSARFGSFTDAPRASLLNASK